LLGAGHTCSVPSFSALEPVEGRGPLSCHPGIRAVKVALAGKDQLDA
jgi:hypothetical protein